jgi:8-oxo-dGTP diphosphatase
MMSDDPAAFDGAKVAILRRGEVLTLLRDDIPTIPFPNMWDLLGGGREGAETPFETLARETCEELSLTITPDQIIHHREYVGRSNTELRVHFFIARWDDLMDGAITLGDEGQCWKWMPIAQFIANEKAIPSLRERLQIAQEELGF